MVAYGEFDLEKVGYQSQVSTEEYPFEHLPSLYFFNYCELSCYEDFDWFSV